MSLHVPIFYIFSYEIINIFIIFSDAAAELGWAFTLIIVSIISALLGAIIMVIVLRCRRYVLE